MVKIILVLWLTVSVSDREDNGIYNYLLENNKYAISYSDKIPLKLKEGESFKGRIEAECELDYAVDEIMSDKLNQWISYRAWLCTANKVEILNE